MAISWGKVLKSQSKKACLKTNLMKVCIVYWVPSLHCTPKLLHFTKLHGTTFFTPTFQYNYTNISAISVTFCKSVYHTYFRGFLLMFDRRR